MPYSPEANGIEIRFQNSRSTNSRFKSQKKYTGKYGIYKKMQMFGLNTKTQDRTHLKLFMFLI
jgi:hypothetical protein